MGGVLQLIRSTMDDAVANNLTVMRAFATAVDAAYPMQTSPGVYNENVFRGLDYALEQARQRGIKATHQSIYLHMLCKNTLPHILKPPFLIHMTFAIAMIMPYLHPKVL